MSKARADGEGLGFGKFGAHRAAAIFANERELIPTEQTEKDRLASIQKLLKEAFLSKKPFDLRRSRS